MAPSTCAELLAANRGAWQCATHHPFLEACKSGTILEAQFNAWLVQDGKFALEFTRCAASLLTKAPTDKVDLLLGGLAALKEELLWFGELTSQRGLPSKAPPHPTCQRYLHLMSHLAKQPYAVHAVAFWAIERAYYEGWSNYLPGMVEPYATFGQRWGSAEFEQYVQALEAMADEALAAASEAERLEAASAFQQVCALEQDFWQMAYTAE